MIRRPHLRVLDGAGRLPKADPDAERIVIADVLEHPERVDDVLGICRPEHFSIETHKRVYEAVTALRSTGQLVELGTVAMWLRERERLEAVGGLAFLTGLIGSTPTVADVRVYARAIAELHRRKTIVETAQTIAGEGLAGDEPTDTFASKSLELMSEATEQSDSGKLELAYDVTRRRVAQLTEQWEGKRTQTGLPTGIDALDALTGGMRGLTILAGATGGGKSALGLQIGRHVAAMPYDGAKAGVAFIALEMDKEELTDRAICQISGVSDAQLQSGNFGAEESQAVVSAISEFSSLPIALYDSEVDLNAIRWVARRAQRDFERHSSDSANPCKLRLLILDYLQLAKVDEDAETRAAAIAKLTRGLKLMSKELGIVILALCQFNRTGMNRPDSLPNLWDLKESSSIEQDANQVLFVHRPYAVIADKSSDEAKRRIDEAKIVVAKNRKGATGDVPARFDGKSYRFDPADAVDLDRWAPRESERRYKPRKWRRGE